MAKKATLRRTPKTALRTIDQGLDGWYEHQASEWGKAIESGRALLTQAQLEEIQRAVTECRRTAVRSADLRLPHNAGELLVKALPDMLGGVQATTQPARPSRKALLATQRQVETAIKQTREIRTMLATLIDQSPFDFLTYEYFQEADEVLTNILERFEKILVKGQRPSAKGRRWNVWTSAFLAALALWWRRQGWQPTTSQGGAYMTAAGLVVGFRRGLNGEVAQLDHAAVTKALRGAAKMLEMDSVVREISRLSSVSGSHLDEAATIADDEDPFPDA